MRLDAVMLLGCVGVSGVARAADKSAVISTLLDADRYEDAQKKCDKWMAADPSAEQPLREVCAEAWWPLAEARNTPEAWAEFQKTWAGTEGEKTAHEREANAVFRALPMDVDEATLLEYAKRYADTRPAKDFRKMAGDVAVREATDPETAREVARRYPGHAGLPRLVERFPDAFVSVGVEGRAVVTLIDPPVTLPSSMTPSPHWMARWPNGHLVAWDEAVRDYLVQWGVPEEFIDALPVPDTPGPRLPICFAPGRPPGWGPVVQVLLGAAQVVQELPWDPGCGPDTPPVFLTVQGERVVGLSLAAGHQVDLRGTTSGPQHRQTAAAWLKAQGLPLLAGDRIFRKAGDSWLVYPLQGGVPWISGQGPEGVTLPLGAALQGGGFPSGWRLESVSGGVRVVAPQPVDWPLMGGDVRVLSPLVQRVTGLTPAAVEGRPVGAPALGADAGWRRGRHGAVDVTSPLEGGTPAASQPIDPIGQLSGVPLDLLEIIDGYAMNLDDDEALEQVYRARADERGVVVVVDEGRVFMLGSPRLSGGGKVPVPFAVDRDGHTWFGWSGAGAGTAWVETVRWDGIGYVIEGLKL